MVGASLLAGRTGRSADLGRAPSVTMIEERGIGEGGWDREREWARKRERERGGGGVGKRVSEDGWYLWHAHMHRCMRRACIAVNRVDKAAIWPLVCCAWSCNLWPLGITLR